MRSRRLKARWSYRRPRAGAVDAGSGDRGLAGGRRGDAVPSRPWRWVEPASRCTPTPGRDYVILQIGDSHTAADLFTGEVRDRLQEKFGAGGLFLPPGIPKAGVQSAEINIRADDAWTYKAMASTDEPDHFWLSGYTATAHQENAHITFTARGQQAYDLRST